ncbi:MAG: TRAP transporter small permease [Intestinibacillus sp.]
MKKAGDILYKAEAVVAGASFVTMVGVIAINVLARFLLNKSFAWAEEISYMAFNWAVYFGICLVYRSQGLITIDALVDRLPPKAQKIVQVFTFALVGAANIALVIWGMQLSIQAVARKTSMLQIPYFWIDICIPIACAILAIYSFDNMVKVLQGKEVQAASLEERS